MLKELRIQNFAIIDKIEVSFGAGLNIISGETGAGKSILMDALFLILGGRSSTDLIRRGASEAIVEAAFDISNDKDLQNFLKDLAIPVDDDLIVRRQVHSSGKNRILVNGTLANATTLGSITSRLVDLCSQHDQQLLMRAEEQLLWVDRFGELEVLREKTKAAFDSWNETKKSLEALSTSFSERSQRSDFLNFQLQELKDAELSDAQEDQRLESELKTLASAEQLFALASEAENAISGTDSDAGFLSRVGSLLQKSKSLQAVDPRLSTLSENLESLRLYATEASHFLRDYSSKVEHNEGRLEEIHGRSALLGKLKRKYGPSLGEVLENRERFTKELANFENFDAAIADAEQAVAKARKSYDLIAKELSTKRQKAAKDLSAAVIKELADLQMDRARFVVDFEALENPSATGFEQARYLIAANPGEPLGLLQKVASGGELSRIMLAIHNVISTRGGVGVYLFDEVDAGIGGKTAAAVGAKIAKVAEGHQVICITHLAQVACFAAHHLRVEKEVKKLNKEERTSADVKELASEGEKIAELARMLSGLDNDKAALANAAAMRSKALLAGKKAPAAKARGREASL